MAGTLFFMISLARLLKLHIFRQTVQNKNLPSTALQIDVTTVVWNCNRLPLKSARFALTLHTDNLNSLVLKLLDYEWSRRKRDNSAIEKTLLITQLSRKWASHGSSILRKYISVISQNCGFSWLNKSFPLLNTARNTRLLSMHCNRGKTFLQSSNPRQFYTRYKRKRNFQVLFCFYRFPFFHSQCYWRPRFGSTQTAEPYEFSVIHFPIKNLSAWF